MTCLCFPSLFVQAVLLELEDGLEECMQDLYMRCKVYNLWNVLNNFCVMRIFYVECLINGNMCLNSCVMMCFYVCICDLEWLLCESLWLWLLYLWLWKWDLDLLGLCLCWWSWQDVDLSQHLVLEWVFLCTAGVPDGGILSGQSAVTWLYSSQSKHFMWGQLHATCPNS